MTWTKASKSNSARGPQRVLGCNQRKRQQCGWSRRLEATTDGWVIYSFMEHRSGDGKLQANESGHLHDLSHTWAAACGLRSRWNHTAELIMRKSGADLTLPKPCGFHRKANQVGGRRNGGQVNVACRASCHTSAGPSVHPVGERSV